MKQKESRVNELITLVLNPTSIALGWLKTNNKNSGFELHAYHRHLLNRYEISDDGLCTTPTLTTHIKQFVMTHQIAHLPLGIALKNTICREKFLHSKSASPSDAEFYPTPRNHTMWDYRYLYQVDENSHLFYACELYHPLLLQYKIVTINVRLNLQTIAPQSMALFQLYRYFYGSAFRRVIFGQEMMRHDNDPLKLFTDEATRRLVRMPNALSINLAEEKEYLLAMSGLLAS
jgi:hypothetical protein